MLILFKILEVDNRPLGCYGNNIHTHTNTTVGTQFVKSTLELTYN